MAKDLRSKYWIGTSFLENFGVPANGCDYAVWQRERCPTTDKPHYQFFVVFASRQRLSHVKKVLGECHAEPAKDPSASRKYCMKEDTRIQSPIEIGVWTMGNTPPLKRLKSQSVLSLIEERPNLWRNLRSLRELKEAVSPPRDFMTKGLFFSGPPGVGKSRSAHLISEFLGTTCFVADHTLKWFDPYMGEDVAVFEETRTFEPIGMLLKLVDRYPLQVPVKGCFRNWRPLLVIFTSNLCMEDLLMPYDDKTKTAVKRRIQEIKF